MKEKARLPELLRQTAERLDQGARYEWGHMGRCNCGHLVQTITDMTDREISKSVHQKLDEWTEHAQTYCSQTGSPVEDLFRTLEDVGFSHRDVIALEHLTDPRVVRHLGQRGQRLRRNHVPDVTLYMRTLAEIVESEEVCPSPV